MSTTHQYKPLDQEATEIRLLHLLELVDGAEHGYEEQCIRGRFEYTSIQGKGDMEEKTPYRALSYVWGAPNLTSAIILDDDSQIRVSHNLLIAIKHVFWHRYAPHAMPIWIDAVCIDQSNNEEKSWQVERMGSIYSRAFSTLIFLGQARSEAEAKELETVIPIFGRLGAMAADWKILGDERDKQMFYSYASVLRWMDDISPKLGISTHEFMVRQVAIDLVSLRELGAGLLPLDCILARPWWSRIWVLQELFMSPRPIFLIDSCTIPARGLLLALHLFVQILQELDFEDTANITPEQRVAAFSKCYSIQTLPHMTLQTRYLRRREIRDDKATPISTDLSWLLELLQECTNINATDPRDYVYGLLGFITYWKNGNARIHPDYSKTVQEVYIDTASSLIQSGYNDILRMAIAQHNRMHELPSWLPDFSARMKDGRSRPSAKEGPFYFTINTELQASMLELKGYGYGEIVAFDTTISETHEKGRYGEWVDHATDEDLDAFFAKVIDVIMEPRESTEDAQSDISVVTLAMRRYMAAVYNHTNQRDEPFKAIEALLRRRLDQITNKPTQMSASLPRYNVDELPRASKADLEYEELQSSDNPTRVAFIDERVACIRMMGEGSLFMCRRGHWGAASNKIATGDVVVRLEIDPAVLYVLRPIGDEKFEVVSLAAVPGMDDLVEEMEASMTAIWLV